MVQFTFPSGVAARTFNDRQDFGLVAEVFKRAASPESDESLPTADEIENEFTNTQNFNVEDGLLIVEAGRVPVGYVLGRWNRELSGTHIYRHIGRLVPGFRRRGIGTAMLAWAQGYLSAIASGHAADDKQFQTDASDADVGCVHLVRADGYQPVAQYASMIRPDLENIPDRPLPGGVEIRPVSEDHLRAVWEADVEAFRDHFGAIEPNEKDWERFVGDPNRDPSLWKVAWSGDQVVGQVRTFVNEEANRVHGRKRAYTEDISTTRQWRGRGVAGALICASLRDLKARGYEDAGLGVHVENPTGAYRLYEGLGFRMTTSGATYQRPI